MPKVAARHALTRQWELLKKLPSRGIGLTSSELTTRLRDAGFSATKRTIERDLKMLEQLFPLRCNESSEPYRWSWAEGSVFELPGLDYTDALSLTLVEDILGKLAPCSVLRVLQPKFEQARKKLGTMTGNRYAKWKECVRYVPPTLPFQPPKVDSSLVETVQEAIVAGRQLEAGYTALTAAQTRTLTLHPLAIIQRGPIGYLVATAFDYTDPRLFALHRLGSVRLSALPARAPKDFSLDAFLESGAMDFGEGGLVRLKAVVSNKLACYLTESALTSNQKLKAIDQEQYVLTATIKDSWQLHFWILSQGAEIVVTKPAHLRERIKQDLQSALAGYRSS